MAALPCMRVLIKSFFDPMFGKLRTAFSEMPTELLPCIYSLLRASGLPMRLLWSPTRRKAFTGHLLGPPKSPLGSAPHCTHLLAVGAGQPTSEMPSVQLWSAAALSIRCSREGCPLC